LPLSATGDDTVLADAEVVAVGDAFVAVVAVACGDAAATPDIVCAVVVFCAVVVAVGSLPLLDPTLHATVPMLRSPRTDSTVKENRSCWR
jgi:hypothetical protein